MYDFDVLQYCTTDRILCWLYEYRGMQHSAPGKDDAAHSDHGMDMPMAPSSSSHNDGSHDMMMQMMQMTFYWGKRVHILFDGWSSHNLGQYLFSLLAIFCIAFFYEWLSTFRASAKSSVMASKEANNLTSPFLLHRLYLTVLFAIHAVTGYALMLMVMTFNGGIFIVIIAGLTVAYFVFEGYNKSPKVVAGHHV
ncbi:hypothetical protein R1sor_025624 [Riccia sorocarpa]|uniref:Copper transport protein n=1 Tax=Riccia sorocarpa TaxID=122646 RepID=A0ABD3GAN9_9MARC